MRDDSRSDPELISVILNLKMNILKNGVMIRIDYQSEIFNELKNMIPAEEETLRVKDGSYYYYSRIKANQQYSTYFRNSSNEEIILDVNKEAEGHEFYNVAGLNISPDEDLNDLWRRFHWKTRIYTADKRFKKNKLLSDEIIKVSPNAIWSSDSKYIIYAKKDEETLIQNQIFVHKLALINLKIN